MPRLKHASCILSLLLLMKAGTYLRGQSSEFTLPAAEVNLFGGTTRYYSYPERAPDPFRSRLADSAMVGIRASWNAARHFGLEGGYSYGWNNLRLQPSPGAPAPYNLIGLGNRTSIASLTPVVFLNPPEHHFRVFLKGGPAAFIFSPTGDAKQDANLSYSFLNAGGLDTDVKYGVLYGIGFKGYFSRKFGVRFDAEGSAFSQPHFKLPGALGGPGSTYIPTGGIGTLYQVSGGIFFGFGGNRPAPVAVAPPPPPPPPPSPPKPEPELAFTNPGVRTVDAGCPGDSVAPIPLSVTATTSLPGHRPAYRWTVNGQPAGQNSPQFGFVVPENSGQYRVGVTVTDDPANSDDPRTAPARSSDVLLVNVREYRPPSISGSAAPTQLALGDRASLTITPQGNDCNKQIVYECRSDEGRVTGTPPNQFDSTGVVFDQANRARLQSKTVNISCTVRDARGGTGSVNIPVAVNLAALQVQRLDDIIFAQNNARVNNCGKRILLEDLYPQLTQHPDWDLVLVGHTAADERAGGRGTPLDRQRLMNVAAALTGGSDTCSALEPSRVRFSLAGTDQNSEPKPAFCGTSTRTSVTERAGQTISGDDPNAKLRRVEIYLVPKGAALPEGVSQLQVVPQADLKALGCPR
jgi:outer membrane protein OmpA-like peptidoglycan-associated protein